ncbi:hypothetical protein DMENIID0001_065280 [Sergentomyia squamirostris]
MKNRIALLSKKFPNDIHLKERSKRVSAAVRMKVDMEREQYYVRKFRDSTNDSKKRWDTINEVLGRKRVKSNVVTEISRDGVIYSDPVDIAEVMNDFFVNIPLELSRDIVRSVNPEENLGFYAQNSIYTSPTSGSEIIKIVLALNNSKSVGPDGFSTFLLKNILYQVVDVLTFMFNRCLVMGVFPDSLKEVVVVPVFKKGSVLEPSNYRPISLVSVFAKVLEKIMKGRIVSFLEGISFFSPNQFGFRRGISTEDAMLTVLGVIMKGINEGKKVTAIFEDLTKAFDTVNHRLLLEKIWDAGLRGPMYDMIVSYLENRVQRVRLNGCLSSPARITCGVPQGTVLGPLLFLIYVNDIFRLKVNGNIMGYADDLVVVFRGDDWSEAYNQLEHDERIIRQWLDWHYMSLSNKSVFINFMYCPDDPILTSFTSHSSACTRISCLDKCFQIPVVDEYKYLGVTIDSRLSWKEHVRSLCNKLIPIALNARRLRRVCPSNVLRAYYYACAESHLRYGLSLWGGCFASTLDPVYSAQRFILRSLTGKRKFDSLRTTWTEWRILPLKYRFRYCALKAFYRRVGFFKSRRIRPSRNGLMAVVPRPFRDIFKRSVVYMAPVLFNQLPPTIKAQIDSSCFMHLVTENLVSELELDLFDD